MHSGAFREELPEVVWRFGFALFQKILIHWLKSGTISDPSERMIASVEQYFRSGRGYEYLLNEACSIGIGRHVLDTSTRRFFRRQSTGSKYYCIILETLECRTMSKEEVLSCRAYNWVGVMLLPADRPNWVYVVPPGWPYGGIRCFRLSKDYGIE